MGSGNEKRAFFLSVKKSKNRVFCPKNFVADQTPFR
jgi:hypothetical protein